MGDAAADTDRVEALAEGADPPPIEQPAAAVTLGDLDAVLQEVVDAIPDDADAAYAAGKADAARHYEQALKHRLGLDDADHRD
ncbi:hypothetical protein [Halobellus rubicundus]|uniref:Uncharacterized protein n=1 Tax=Halobellus rubicundus TaxID=2996466 RepID=A0ABD5MDR0_9EURY